MARRMEPKDRDELALDDKLDVARTMVTLNKRIERRHALNDIEAQIRQAHQREVNRGEVTSPVVPDANALLAALGVTPQIGADEENGSTS